MLTPAIRAIRCRPPWPRAPGGVHGRADQGRRAKPLVVPKASPRTQRCDAPCASSRRAWSRWSASTLPLLVAGIRTDHEHGTATADHLALLTHRLDGSSDLHLPFFSGLVSSGSRPA